MHAIPFIFGALCIALAVHHEIRWWWRLRRWEAAVGEVTDVQKSTNDDTPKAVVQFWVAGEKREFVSDYGPNTVDVGSSVQIVFDPLGEKAEILSPSNRWLFTLAPLILGILFLAVGWSAHQQDSAQ